MKNSQVILMCGSGGVGKTTLSATLGLHYAFLGHKTIVLTIDPAKRLATSLGLKEIDSEPQKIALKKCKGELYAMMLDTKRMFDQIIEKYSPNQEVKEQILGNTLYQHMSKMMAGTQEYMAMEKLLEIYEMDEFDTIIIDTPPMQNAKDFLAAPQKMVDMINNSMMHLLLKPTLKLGKSSFKFFEQGSKQILKIFDRITGFAFLQDLSEMFIAFKGLLNGFQERAGEVKELLHNPNTKFWMVCTSQSASLSDAEIFLQDLQNQGFEKGHVFFNRVYEGKVLSPQHLKTAQETLEKQGIQNTKTLIDVYKTIKPSLQHDKKAIQSFCNEHSIEQSSIIPLFLSDIHSLKQLKDLADYIHDSLAE